LDTFKNHLFSETTKISARKAGGVYYYDKNSIEIFHGVKAVELPMNDWGYIETMQEIDRTILFAPIAEQFKLSDSQKIVTLDLSMQYLKLDINELAYSEISLKPEWLIGQSIGLHRILDHDISNQKFIIID
jgi:hypothetical protein